LNQTRFENLWSRCCYSGSPVQNLFSGIKASYGEPHRYYHTSTHVEHCLRQFDLAHDEIKNDADAIELALWFHDVEYDPIAADNELKSADRFKRVALGNMSPDLIAQIYRLIMITIHNDPPQAEDEKYVADIDLSGFGLPWQEFIKDNQNVRNELPGLTDREFAEKNGRFLKQLLDRPSIYSSDFYKERYEQTARENMKKQVALLNDCKN